MLEAQLEMTDKIGYLLLKKGIIDLKILEQALKIKEADQTKLKRNLAQILVDEFKFDHDIIFREVAVLYAFKELNFPIEELPEERINEIKNMMTRQGEEIKKLLLDHRVVPFKFDDKIRDKLILAAVDPTDRALAKIAYALNAKKFEINYLRKKDFDKLVGLLVPTENEYLKMMQESNEELHVADDESSVDEEELDAEINKSALINLVEAALIEGTR
ncbi:MAG: type II/IV secretion system protein, partial [Ignavibacteria bacterium]|nr:type II/IV secretion system protein [Ignavibacteria bacterium]